MTDRVIQTQLWWARNGDENQQGKYICYYNIVTLDILKVSPLKGALKQTYIGPMLHSASAKYKIQASK